MKLHCSDQVCVNARFTVRANSTTYIDTNKITYIRGTSPRLYNHPHIISEKEDYIYGLVEGLEYHVI